MSKIRVLLVDDHALIRTGLRMLINAQRDMETVGEAANCREALEQINRLQPDVVSLDLTMPGGNSIKLIEQLHSEHPEIRVLVLTMHDDPAYFRAVMAAGGAGYLVKSAADSELLTAIRTVHQGRTFANVDLDGKKHLPATPGLGLGSLSDREREVLELLAKGFTNQEIAAQLFLSVKTIETYRARIAGKLGLRTRAELVRYALEVGLLAANEPYPGTDGI